MLERYITDGLIGAPDILYKYRSWDNEYHKDILLSRRLYYSNPASFNDPFDINIRISYQSLSKQDLFLMFKKILKEQEPNLPMAKLTKKARVLVASTDSETILRQEEKQLELIRSTYGILCLCSNNSNILMWSYYANSHKGFVLGFNTKKLFGKKAGLLAEVNYTDEYPLIIPNQGIDVMDHVIPQLVYKSNVWRHEGEYRFVKKRTSNFFEFSPDDVEEILLGANISAEDEKEIMSVCKNSYPTTKIYKMVLHPTKFQLELNEVKI